MARLRSQVQAVAAALLEQTAIPVIKARGQGVGTALLQALTTESQLLRATTWSCTCTFATQQRFGFT